jgi:hypothetical protein
LLVEQPLSAVPLRSWHRGRLVDTVSTWTVNAPVKELVSPARLVAADLMRCRPFDRMGANCQEPDAVAATTPRTTAPSTVVTRLPGIA